MHEKMIFPKKPQEFIEQHSIEYINGEKVMPKFRVEQMIAHYVNERDKEIIKRLEELASPLISVEDVVKIIKEVAGL